MDLVDDQKGMDIDELIEALRKAKEAGDNIAIIEQGFAGYEMYPKLVTKRVEKK